MRAEPDPFRALRVIAAAVVCSDGTTRGRRKPLTERTEVVQAGLVFAHARAVSGNRFGNETSNILMKTRSRIVALIHGKASQNM
jgi:hypothetical protein